MAVRIAGAENEEKRLATLVGRIFHIIEMPEAGVDVYLISDEEMRTLYLKTAGKDKVTNVLSFPEPKGFVDPDVKGQFLGEIYLAPAHIAREAKEMGISAEEWEKKLIIHGILHLLGFDHIKDEDAEVMEKKEEWVIERLKDVD